MSPIERIPTYPVPDGKDDYLQRLVTALQCEASLRILDFDIRKLSNIIFGSATWNPGNLADGASESVTVTVTNAALGDPAFGGFSSITVGGWQISAIVTAADEAEVTITNHTGGALNLVEGTVNVVVFQV